MCVCVLKVRAALVTTLAQIPSPTVKDVKQQASLLGMITSVNTELDTQIKVGVPSLAICLSSVCGRVK